MKLPIIPMEPGANSQPFSDVHYAFEVEMGGLRTIAYVANGEVKLEHKGSDVAGKYLQITAAFQRFKFSAILDGEIVALNDDGIFDPVATRRWRSDDDGPLYYYAYDLLLRQGDDYMKEPLYVRKSVLKGLLPPSPVIRYHDEIVTHGEALFRWAASKGLGVIAKRIDSIYRPGRSKDWVRIPVRSITGKQIKKGPF